MNSPTNTASSRSQSAPSTSPSLKAREATSPSPPPTPLTFGGNPSIVIPPGATAISDPAALNLPAFADLSVSIFLPAQTLTKLTYHGSAYQTNLMVAGNMVGQASLASATPKPFANWFFLKGVDVKTTPDSAAVVALGDSITDGTRSTNDLNNRWPDELARRLAADKKTRAIGVLNEGIGGNRLLHDGTGLNALARFDRDVLSRPGVRFLILLEGINDIGHAADPVKPYDIITAQDLIQAYAQIAERAHAHGIKVFGATPYSVRRRKIRLTRWRDHAPGAQPMDPDHQPTGRRRRLR